MQGANHLRETSCRNYKKSITKFRLAITAFWATLARALLAKLKVRNHFHLSPPIEGMNVITGQKVAIKILNKKKTKQMGIFDKLKREIKILKNTFMHPNIIKIYDYIDTSSELYIIMEIAVGGELFDYITQKDKVSFY
jgi:serine/threonine protein kinase